MGYETLKMEVLKERIRRRVVKEIAENTERAKDRGHEFYSKQAEESTSYLLKLKKALTFQELHETAPYHDQRIVVEEVLKAMDGFLIFGQLLGPVQMMQVVRNIEQPVVAKKRRRDESGEDGEDDEEVGPDEE